MSISFDADKGIDLFCTFAPDFNLTSYMKTSESLFSISKFIAEYSAHLMGAGVHTSRVVRNTKRIGEAFGVDVKLGVFHKNIILTIIDNETQEACNEVIDIPTLPISFEHNSELSALSWEAFDHHLPLEELKEKYHKIVSAPKMSPWIVLILVGFANASFCKLFGGDPYSMGIVFVATLLGFFLRQQMQKRKINHYIIFIVSAFIASLCASVSLLFDITSEIAIATSVLYLVPGVPLINGVIDIVEGYVLTGFARLTQASLLIVSIAIGLSFTLLLVKNSLI